MQNKPDTARMLAALIKRCFPDGVSLTREEIEDAARIEMKEIFLTDRVELKLEK